jgi:response regulator RpfG family c-di-GMP phosphodiesterase
MPNMNGFELFNEIRRVNDKIKVCFVTAFDPQNEEKDLKITIPSTLHDSNEKPVVIRKPISIHDLVQMVKAEIPLQNISQSSSSQIHFLICEKCFWYTSMLYQIPDGTTILNWHNSCKEKMIRS